MENASDKQAKLQNAMSRAKKLLQLESNGTLDKIAKGVRSGIDSSLNGGDVMTSELMTTTRNRMMEAPMIGGNMGSNAVNVPSAIRESFAKNPIDEASMYAAFGGGGASSDLDFLTESIEMQSPPQQRINAQTQDVRRLVNEGLGNQNATAVYQQQTAQVDYPMIRTIVEEIVRKYSLSLKNKILSESKGTNEVNTIALGKTFKFLDSNGNIYECQMKKIGNLNNKKRNVNE